MPGRETKISAPAQGDQWFTLWPDSTSRQSSHRKIMSPSNEFMQMAVHLSEVKKSHFHFKRRTLEVLNIHELTEIQKFSICTWAVSAHACCLILVEFTPPDLQGLLVQRETWLYPMKSHTKSVFLERCKWKICGLHRQMLLQHNFRIKNKHSKMDNC